MNNLTVLPSKRIAPQLPVRKFNARSVIDCRPDTLWKIESGFVITLTWTEDGTLVLLGIWGPGDWVGRSLTQVNPFQIECLTPVKAAPVPIVRVPNLADALMTHLHQLETLMIIRSGKRADIMLLKLLQWLADRFGQNTPKGRLIDLRLTQQDLADLLGITRITVTRILGQLEQQEYIQRLSLQKIILRQDELWHYEI